MADWFWGEDGSSLLCQSDAMNDKPINPMKKDIKIIADTLKYMLGMLTVIAVTSICIVCILA